MTIFARLGAAGLLVFVGIVAVIGRLTRQAVRLGPQEAAPWCAAWIILASACFGVVLEGPMGAVVFWTVLGIAHARLFCVSPAKSTPQIEKGPAPTLRSATAPV